MKVFKVNHEVSVDIGFTSFTLYPNDFIFTENNQIYQVGYHFDNGFLNIFPIKNSRVKESIRIGHRIRWEKIDSLTKDILEDITVSYVREEKLKLLFN